MKISIVVPIYNSAVFLPRCLDSLLAQTIDSYELILINDGSTDDSQAVIDDYVKKYPNIVKAYYKTNGGLSSARNYGIARSSGEYLGFVDSDDWVAHDMFQLLYDCAKLNNSDLVCCGYHEIFADRELFHVPRYLGHKHCHYKIEVVSWNKVYRTKFIKHNDLLFLDGVLHEDFDFTTRALSMTRKISFIDDYLYVYNRLNVNSITVSGGGMNALSCSKILNNLFLWKKEKHIIDSELNEYLLCWVYDYLFVYEQDQSSARKFIIKNYFNILAIANNKIKVAIKVALKFLSA